MGRKQTIPLFFNRALYRRKVINTLLAGAFTSASVWPAHAQSQISAADQPADSAAATAAPATHSEELALGEVVVTATRQSESSQRVAIALTAVGADQMAKEGITDVTHLGGLAPSLFVLPSVGEGSARVAIRGLSGTDYTAAGSPAVATYIDDVYQASQYGIASSLYDLQRVEILRGPQGTTFGKNTTGGAIAYVSQTPVDHFEGYVTGRLAGGDQASRFLEAAVNLPLVDKTLAMRISGRLDGKSGWVRDTVSNRELGGGHSESGRFQLRWTPTAETAANLTLFDTKWLGDTLLGHGLVLPEVVNPKVIGLSPYNLYDNFDNSGATLRIEQNLGSFALTSISHYRRTRYWTAQDLDGRPEDSADYVNTFGVGAYLSNSLAKQYGQEIRLTSDPTRRLSGLLGAYYEHDQVQEENNEASTLEQNYNDLFRGTTTTRTYALFGNLKFRMSDSLSVVTGIRKSDETRTLSASKFFFQSQQGYRWTQSNLVFDGAPPITPDQDLEYGLRLKSTPVTWDATLDYNPDKSLLLFARFAKGFRSGGFNPPVSFYGQYPFAPATIPPAFQGEMVQSYEAGIKTSLLQNKLRINSTVYHYNYNDQQVTEYINIVAVTENAGRSKVDGAELEITAAPTDHWELRGGLSYTDARYTQYSIPAIGADYSGNRLVQAPKWDANTSISYETPVWKDYSVRATTIWHYRSTTFFDAANDPNMTDGPRVFGDLRLAFEAGGKGLSVAAFVNNMTNQRPLQSGFVFVPNLQYIQFFTPARTFGADVSYHW